MSVKSSLRNFLINLTLIGISTLFAILLSEAALRLIGVKPLFVSPERDRFWKYDALLGWAHQPGQEGIFETPQFRTTVRINEKGLRDRSHSYQRQGDMARILVLGDSFAWGYGVEESERFSQRLETSLDLEVINAGVSGYSTDQELLWYQKEGIKYETDLVILEVAGNDVGDNELSLVSNIYYKPRFVLEEGKLVLKGYPVPETSAQGKFVYAVSQRSALAFFIVQRYFDALSIYTRSRADSPEPKQLTSISTAPPEEPFQLTIELIEEIRQTAESHGATFMIVTTPRWWNSRSEETYADFVTILEDDGFLVIDVESLPGFEPEDMLIPDDGHWSQEGHQFVAEKIAAFVHAHDLLPQP